MGSNRPWFLRGRHINGERLWDVPTSCQRMGGRSSPAEVEPRWIRCIVPTIDPVENGDYPRHRGGGDEMSRDCSATFLSHDPLLHQPYVAFLLFGGSALWPQGGLQYMVQLDLIGDTVFSVEGAKSMHFGRNTRVVQQEDGGIYLSSPRVVSNEKGVVSVVDGGVSEMPSRACVKGFDIYGGDKVRPPEDYGFGSFRRCGQPLCWLQISGYVQDKDIIMPIVAFSQLMPSDSPASSKVSLSSLTKVVSSLILALQAMI